VDKQYDIAVIGVGRIGLPLSLFWASQARRVLGIDRDAKRVQSLSGGKMEYFEWGMQALLDKALEGEMVTFSTNMADVSNAPDIVVTIGSASRLHQTSDVPDILTVIKQLAPFFHHNHHLVLRGTLAPGTFDLIYTYIEQNTSLKIGRDFFLTHCPERIAEGRFLEEIDRIPQIIGASDSASTQRALDLFASSPARKLVTSPVQAELAKIWSNVLRYATFALPNLLLQHCEGHQANVFEVIDLINDGYPRGGMAQPGFTGGLCMRKDFTFVEEDFPGDLTFLSAIWRLQESMPHFLIKKAKKYISSFVGCKVALLGLAFKAGSDDRRDALSEQFIRCLEREGAELTIHDPYLQPVPLEDLLSEAKIVILCTNHPYYASSDFRSECNRLLDRDVLLIDVWNLWQTNKVFCFPQKQQELHES
jgi:UDP-N-acetyl-D-mannosaminuronic acid dehydrogenase